MRISQLNIKQGSKARMFEFERQLTLLPLTFSRATEIIDMISVALGAYVHGIDAVKNEAPQIKVYGGNNNPNHPHPFVNIFNLVAGQKAIQLSATGTFEGEHISWEVGTDSKLNTSYKDAKSLTKKASTMLSQSRAGGEDVIFPMLGRYGCDMDQTDTEIPYMKSEEGIIHGYKNAFNPPDKTGTDALSWFKTMSDEIRKFDQDSDKALMKAFKEALISVIGGSDFQEPSIVPFVKDIYYDFKKDDMVILLSLLFDDEGEKNYYSTVSKYAKNIVGLTADIAYRCIKLNPHLGQDAVTKTPGIVLIDDINSYLFSKEDADFAKRELNILMKTFPQIQFITSFYGDHNILTSLWTHYEFPKNKLEVINEMMQRPWKHAKYPYRTIDPNGGDYYFLIEPMVIDNEWDNSDEDKELFFDLEDPIRFADIVCDEWAQLWAESLQSFDDYMKIMSQQSNF